MKSILGQSEANKNLALLPCKVNLNKYYISIPFASPDSGQQEQPCAQEVLIVGSLIIIKPVMTGYCSWCALTSTYSEVLRNEDTNPWTVRKMFFFGSAAEEYNLEAYIKNKDLPPSWHFLT